MGHLRRTTNQANPCGHPTRAKNPRWKSQIIKIHKPGYRFAIDFESHTLGYGFLFGNQKHLARVSRLLGFAECFL
jgi:hypothetical protein